MKKLAFIIASLILFGINTAQVTAHEYKAGDIMISHPWTRATPIKGLNGVGYMTLINQGKKDDRLISASCDCADRVELHKTEEKDGMMHMSPQPNGVLIPAQEFISLEPSGYHLMLIKLKNAIKEDKRVPLKLIFEKAGELEIELAVHNLGDSSKVDHSSH